MPKSRWGLMMGTALLVAGSYSAAFAQAPPAPAPEGYVPQPLTASAAPCAAPACVPAPACAAAAPACATLPPRYCGKCSRCKGDKRGLWDRMFGRDDCRHDHHAHDSYLYDEHGDFCYHAGVLPFGTSVQAILGAQVARGDAAQMVLHHYDFEPDAARLTCRGMLQLGKIAAELPKTPFPLIIEASLCKPDLDAARRDAVLEALAQGPFPVPAERVIIAAPPAPGLDAIAADAANQNEQQLLRSGGGPIGPPPGAGVGLPGFGGPPPLGPGY